MVKRADERYVLDDYVIYVENPRIGFLPPLLEEGGNLSPEGQDIVSALEHLGYDVSIENSEDEDGD